MLNQLKTYLEGCVDDLNVKRERKRQKADLEFERMIEFAAVSRARAIVDRRQVLYGRERYPTYREISEEILLEIQLQKIELNEQ